MEKVAKETALKEVQNWLEYKKVDETKIKENKANIENLASAISAGHVVLDSDFNLVHTLKFPILAEDNSPVAEKLTYKPRLKMKEIRRKTKNVDASDTMGLLSAYVSAITTQNTGIIDELDSEDNKVAQAIAIFFL